MSRKTVLTKDERGCGTKWPGHALQCERQTRVAGSSARFGPLKTTAISAQLWLTSKIDVPPIHREDISEDFFKTRVQSPARAREAAVPEDQFFGTGLFVCMCVKSCVLRCSMSQNELEGPFSGCLFSTVLKSILIPVGSRAVS